QKVALLPTWLFQSCVGLSLCRYTDKVLDLNRVLRFQFAAENQAQLPPLGRFLKQSFFRIRLGNKFRDSCGFIVFVNGNKCIIELLSYYITAVLLVSKRCKLITY